MEPVIHQVGPRYGISDYLRKVDAAWNVTPREAPWVYAAEAAMKKRLPSDRAIDLILEGFGKGNNADAVIVTGSDSGTKLRKPFHSLSGHVVQHVTFSRHVSKEDEDYDPQTSIFNQTDRVEAGLILHDFNVVAQPKKICGQIVVGHLGFSRHALERIYEREHVDTGRMHQTISQIISDIRMGLAFSIHHDLAVGKMPDITKMIGEDAEHASTHAVELVPCGNGLVLVEAIVCLMLRSPQDSTNLITIRKGTFQKAVVKTNDRVVTVCGGGQEISIVPLQLARTYLSEDILRPEQIAYRDLFREIMRDADMKAIDRHVFGYPQAHQKIIVPEQTNHSKLNELRDLVYDCAKENEGSGLWTMGPSTGW